MSCDTILRLKGHITAEQIIDYIDKNYKFIGSSVKENNYGVPLIIGLAGLSAIGRIRLIRYIRD